MMRKDLVINIIASAIFCGIFTAIVTHVLFLVGMPSFATDATYVENMIDNLLAGILSGILTAIFVTVVMYLTRSVGPKKPKE